MSIDKLTVIDSGNGQAARSAVQLLPSNIVGLVEQVENATGVDLLSLLQTRGGTNVKLNAKGEPV